MSLQRIWKSTGTTKAPTGNKRQGTFRDVSLSKLPSELVDQVDSACMERSIPRSQYILEYWQSCENWDESVFPEEVVRAAAQIGSIPNPPGHIEFEIAEERRFPFDFPPSADYSVPSLLLKD